MKKYMTRALALLLTVVMVLGAVPFAMAQEPSVTVTARTEKAAINSPLVVLLMDTPFCLPGRRQKLGMLSLLSWPQNE